MATACRREQEPARPAESTPALSAPTAMVINPLSKETTGYTNEMQAKFLQNQAADLGIQRFASSYHTAADDETPPPTVSYAEGIQRTRELEQSLAAQRHSIDRNKPKSVDLPGNTPMLLQTPADSGGAPTPETPTSPAPTR
jgi:hypothetical protein